MSPCSLVSQRGRDVSPVQTLWCHLPNAWYLEEQTSNDLVDLQDNSAPFFATCMSAFFQAFSVFGSNYKHKKKKKKDQLKLFCGSHLGFFNFQAAFVFFLNRRRVLFWSDFSGGGSGSFVIHNFSICSWEEWLQQEIISVKVLPAALKFVNAHRQHGWCFIPECQCANQLDPESSQTDPGDFG